MTLLEEELPLNVGFQNLKTCVIPNELSLLPACGSR